MIPGPYSIYACPVCGNLFQMGSSLSGNTFGSWYYSDGNMFRPMCSPYPYLTKCRKCGTIFLIRKQKKLGEFQWDEEPKPEWKHSDPVHFLDIEDYFLTLKKEPAWNVQSERYIRKRIWWKYNDRIRDVRDTFGEKTTSKTELMFADEADEQRWKENLTRYLELIDPSNLLQRIRAAEIRRNLGEFDECLTILKSIDHLQLKHLKETIADECKRENRWVVKVK